MASFLTGIQNSIIGTYNTLALGLDNVSKTTLWQKTGAVAMPYINRAADKCYPTSLRFKPFTKEFAAGSVCTIIFAICYAVYKKPSDKKPKGN